MKTTVHQIKSDSREQQESAVVECWNRFLEEFPTEQSCMDELRSRILANIDFRCSRCNHVEFSVLANGRTLKCKQCNASKSVTTGTFFQKIRRARAWLGAIWLMEHGLIVSSNRYEKLAGIAQSSALNMMRKLSKVVLVDMEELELADSYFFLPTYCKRSRETPARNHPSAEQHVSEEPADDLYRGNASSTYAAESDATAESAEHDNDFFSDVLTETGMATEFNSTHNVILDALSQSPISLEELSQRTSLNVEQILAALTVLEVGLKTVRTADNRYTLPENLFMGKISNRSVSPNSGHQKNLIKQSIDFIRDYFHGISRKYLQLYLACHWCIKNRLRWRRRALLDACIRYGPLPYCDILDYVTPALVSIPD